MSREKGFKHPKKTIEKMRNSAIGKPGTNTGKKFTKVWKENISQSLKGHKGLEKSKNPNWKGGFKVGGNRILKRVARGTYHSYARILIEKKLDRKLTQKECVHHKDGDWKNNSIKNLELFSSHSEHIKFEQALNKFAKQLLYGKLALHLKPELKKLLTKVK